MDEKDFEGTLVLEKLAEIGKLDLNRISGAAIVL